MLDVTVQKIVYLSAVERSNGVPRHRAPFHSKQGGIPATLCHDSCNAFVGRKAILRFGKRISDIKNVEFFDIDF